MKIRALFTGFLTIALAVTVLAVRSFVSKAQEAPAGLVPFAYNADQRENADESKTTVFHQKWINYRKNDQEWGKINIVPKSTATGWVMNEAPYDLHVPTLANGKLKFGVTNIWKIERGNPKGGRIQKETPLYATKQFTDAVDVAGVQNGNEIFYANALPSLDAHLLVQVHEEKSRFIVKWDAKPSQCVTSSTRLKVNFTEEYDLPNKQPKKKNGENVGGSFELLDGGKSVGSSHRGIGTPQPRIWDSSGQGSAQGNIQKVDLYGKYNPIKGMFYKDIDCAYFDTAVFPVYTDTVSTFYPDPSTPPEVTTVDGYTNSPLSGVWATAHDDLGTNTANDSAAVLSVLARERTDGANYEIRRGIMLFNTATIPDGDTVTAATLDLYGDAITNGDNDGNDFIRITLSSPATNTEVVAGDYDQVGAVDNPVAQATDIDIGSLSTLAYNTFTFNATGRGNVSKTDVSKFGYREGHDVVDVAPDVDLNNEFQVISADAAGTTTDPLLTVTHSVVAAAGGGVGAVFFSLLESLRNSFFVYAR